MSATVLREGTFRVTEIVVVHVAARVHGAGPTRIEDERGDAVGQGCCAQSRPAHAAVGALVDGAHVGGALVPAVPRTGVECRRGSRVDGEARDPVGRNHRELISAVGALEYPRVARRIDRLRVGGIDGDGRVVLVQNPGPEARLRAAKHALPRSREKRSRRLSDRQRIDAVPALEAFGRPLPVTGESGHRLTAENDCHRGCLHAAGREPAEQSTKTRGMRRFVSGRLGSHGASPLHAHVYAPGHLRSKRVWIREPSGIQKPPGRAHSFSWQRCRRGQPRNSRRDSRTCALFR